MIKTKHLVDLKMQTQSNGQISTHQL